jgi:hypothetical protein
MINTGEDGGPLCWECVGARECKAVDAGWTNCSVQAGPNGANCSADGKCGSGSVFPGVVVVARPRETEESRAVVDRINQYFRSDVIPRIEKGWASLQGKGVVTMRHRYRRTGSSNWLPAGVRLFGELLPEDDLPADLLHSAVRYMRRGVRGTSFAPDKWDGEEDEFVLFWGWPVPFPGERVSDQQAT